LVDLGGKGKYRAPEFIWFQTVAPTALKFLNSTKLGKQYQNDIFVGDYNNGNLYHFKLNQNRTGLLLSGTLADKIAQTPQDAKPVILVVDLMVELQIYKLDRMVISIFLHLQVQYIK